MELFYLLTDKSEFKDKTLHEAGRYVVNYAAKEYYNINNYDMEIINNKPQFKTNPIKFSISHTKNIAAVCFDSDEVGFDIEIIRKRDFELISKRMKFNTITNTPEEFYENWTKYEAEYKLHFPVKSRYTAKFLDKYFMSIVSNKNKEIEKSLKIIEVFT